jgi:hypothetical protein
MTYLRQGCHNRSYGMQLLLTWCRNRGPPRMRSPLNGQGSEQFGRDSIKLWPIVDTVDHRLAVYVAAVVLVACVGYLIN